MIEFNIKHIFVLSLSILVWDLRRQYLKWSVFKYTNLLFHMTVFVQNSNSDKKYFVFKRYQCFLTLKSSLFRQKGQPLHVPQYC